MAQLISGKYLACDHFPAMQLQVREMEVLETARESKELQERLTNAEQSWKEKETEWDKQQKMLEERVESLTQQNSMLHEEAEKVCTIRNKRELGDII